MPNTVQLKRSSTANSVPSAGNLVVGELAINYTDGNLFYKNASNVVTVIASNKFSSVTGNVDAGNILTAGLISAAGNITGGNVIAGAGSGGSITGAVLISASGNIIGGALLTAGITSATGNITGGNVLTGGVISATGNITGGNLLTAGVVSATGNITGGNVLGGANVNATTHTGTTVSVTANVTGGNLLTAGLISATGNGVIAGRQLTVGAAYTTFAAAGRGIVAINGTTALLEFASGTANYGYLYHSGSAGNLSLWNTQNGCVSIATNNTERLNISSAGVVSATANVIGGNLLTGGLVSATGNVTGGNILTTGLFSVTGNVTANNGMFTNIVNVASHTGAVVSVTGNVTGGNILGGANVNATTHTGTTVSVTGNITGGNLAVTGSLNATKSGGTLSILTQTSATGYGLTIIPGADTVYDAFTINNATNTLNQIQMFGNGDAIFKGNVGVGTSSPSYRFQVYNNTDGFISRFTGGTASNVNIGVFGSTGSSFGSIGTESNHQFRIFTNGVDRAIIDTGGNLSVTGDVIGYSSSDKKFKTNIRPIPNALSAVEHIGGKLFDWTDEYMESVGHADGYFRQKEDFGIVAQDVQKVFPLAVRTRPDGSLAVDYVKLSALAFASIAELSAKLKDLEGKINDLTSLT